MMLSMCIYLCIYLSYGWKHYRRFGIILCNYILLYIIWYSIIYTLFGLKEGKLKWVSLIIRVFGAEKCFQFGSNPLWQAPTTLYSQKLHAVSQWFWAWALGSACWAWTPTALWVPPHKAPSLPFLSFPLLPKSGRESMCISCDGVVFSETTHTKCLVHRGAYYVP